MSNAKILVVDDEQELLEMLKDRLEANDFEVVLASDGEEGIRMAKSEKPDLVIMDIMMPNMDGGMAVRTLKDNPQTAGIPVIFLTATLDKSEEKQEQKVNIEETFYPAMAKPYDPEKLLMVVNKALKRDHE